MLKTRSIKAQKRADDGVRISVMSRHTLIDGITPDPAIVPGTYDEWQKTLAPPPKLIGAYCRGKIGWDDFERLFRDYLLLPHVEVFVRRLIRRAEQSVVTIMCVEDDPAHCHRRLIAETCKAINPFLEVKIE